VPLHWLKKANTAAFFVLVTNAAGRNADKENLQYLPDAR